VTLRYVTVAEVLAYHARLLQIEGQPLASLTGREKPESAVLRLQAAAFGHEFYPSLAEKAAVLLQGIVVAHPFLDGNKRAALGAMLLFLELNGVTSVADSELLYDLVITVTEGTLRDASDIADVIRRLFRIEE
jgi:death-on-curing protein